MSRTHPTIIQGGMGVAVSSWQLANAVARSGQLGVVSGTALDGVVARVLQDGDPGGHVRRAIAHFPVPEIAERVLAAYYPQESAEALRAAQQMMASSLLDPSMDWAEAERLADLTDFNVLPEFQRLKAEVENG